MEINKILQGDVLKILKTLPDESVQMVMTSPPYFGLRDYGKEGQIGLEKTPEEYVAKMVSVFHEVKRVLKNDGTLWLNLGDSYAGNYSRASQGRAGYGAEREGVFDKTGNGLKPKDLAGIPWRVAFALQADGWYLRQDIIWAKPNPMPESVTDRCTKSHEYLFLLSKSQHYYFDNEAIKEPSVCDDPRMIDGFVPKLDNGKHAGTQQASTNRKQHEPTHAGGGTSFINHNGYFKADGTPIGNPGTRNKRDVWTINTSPYKGAHFATYPEELCLYPIKAGSKEGDVVMDIFAGSGTTLKVAKDLGRNYLGIELNPAYIKLAEERIGNRLF
jgi:DNA modification methylase